MIPGVPPNALPTIDSAAQLELTDGALIWNPNAVQSRKLQLCLWSTLFDWLKLTFVEFTDFESTSSVTVNINSGKISFTAGTPGVPDFAVSSIAALKLLPIPSGQQIVYVSGYYAANDGGGGLFIWDSTNRSSTAIGYVRPDDGMIVAPAGASNGASGCWVRIVTDHTINVRWYGAKGNNVDNDAVPIQKAIYFACNINNAEGGWTVFFPAGKYYIHNEIWMDGTNENVTLSPTASTAAIPWYRWSSKLSTVYRYYSLWIQGRGITILGESPATSIINQNGVPIVDPARAYNDVMKVVRGTPFGVVGPGHQFRNITISGQRPPNPVGFDENFYCHRNAAYGPDFNTCWDWSHKGIVTFARSDLYVENIVGVTETSVDIDNCKLLNFRGETVYGVANDDFVSYLHINNTLIDGCHASMISGEWEIHCENSIIKNSLVNGYESVTDRGIYFNNCIFEGCATGINNVGYVTLGLAATEYCEQVIQNCTFIACGYGIRQSRQTTEDVSSPRLALINGNRFIDCYAAVVFGIGGLIIGQTITNNIIMLDKYTPGATCYGFFTASGSLAYSVIQGNVFSKTDLARASGVEWTGQIVINTANNVSIINNSFCGSGLLRTQGTTFYYAQWAGNTYNDRTRADNAAVTQVDIGTDMAYVIPYHCQWANIRVGSSSNLTAPWTGTIDTQNVIGGSELELFFDDTTVLTNRGEFLFTPGNSTYMVDRPILCGYDGDYLKFRFSEQYSKWILIEASAVGVANACGLKRYGTTAERPTFGSLRTYSRAFFTGWTYYDTTLSALYVWNGSAWVAV